MLLSSSFKKDVILRNFICMCWLRRRDNILHIERNNTNETCICNVRLVFLFWFQSHDRNTFGGNFQDHFLSAIKKIINFTFRKFSALIIKNIWIFPRFSNSVFDNLPGHIRGLEFPKIPAECPFRNRTVTLSKRPNLCQCEAWISETWAPTYDDLAFYVAALLGLHRISSSRFLQSEKISIESVLNFLHYSKRCWMTYHSERCYRSPASFELTGPWNAMTLAFHFHVPLQKLKKFKKKLIKMMVMVRLVMASFEFIFCWAILAS